MQTMMWRGSDTDSEVMRYRDSMLAGERRRLTQQLCLRDSDEAGNVSNQDSVIQFGTSRCQWNQIPSLHTHTRAQRTYTVRCVRF